MEAVFDRISQMSNSDFKNRLKGQSYSDLRKVDLAKLMVDNFYNQNKKMHPNSVAVNKFLWDFTSSLSNSSIPKREEKFVFNKIDSKNLKILEDLEK